MSKIRRSKKELIIKCDCGGHHYFELTQWDNEGIYFAMITADITESWYKRIVEAIGYVFGKHLYFHEVVISLKDIQKLKKFLSK